MQNLIYETLNKEQLSEMLESFNYCTNLTIRLIDKEGNTILRYGEDFKFCNVLKKYLPPRLCENLYVKAGSLAVAFGETYIFSCHGNLNHIIFPIVYNNEIIGSILAGPFLMDNPESSLIQDIAVKYPMPTGAMFELYDEISQIKVLTPKNITHASRLLYYSCSGIITEGKQRLILNQEKLHQQSKIGESIQMYKTHEFKTEYYPYEKEKELITKVKTGNIKDAKGVLNDLLGYVLFSEGNKLESIKTRAIELSSLLSRTAIEGGAATDSTLKMNIDFLKSIEQIKDLDELCYRLQKIVEEFTEVMFHYVPSKNNEVIKSAIRYITKNFNKPITLEEVAINVHLSPSYFSSLFKKSTGSSFKEYLNMIRVEESKRLLSNTDYSIIDISVATGFESQSYFTKVFRKYTNQTPKQFR